jgi:hypothetical protein
MIACALMRKKYVVRTGGDFLWESYVERTGDMVLFRDFYGSSPENFLSRRVPKLSRKEKLIFKWGGKVLRKAKVVIFSTEWQRDIFEKAYGLDPKKCAIVENYCGERLEQAEPEERNFVAATRDLKWKNIESLKEAFKDAQNEIGHRGLPNIELDCGKAVYDSFVEKIHHAYAVALVSIGDISPNMIFDAIRAGTPFILTKENGIMDRIKDAAILVNPLNKAEIAEKIVWLSNPVNRAAQAEKVRKIVFTHSWEEIGKEIVDIWKR